MAKRKAVYYIIPDGYTVTEALIFGKHIGPCDSKSEAMKVAGQQKDSLTGRYSLVKAHFDTVDEFAVAPVTVASFVRS
jgi:hypothetical protein